MTPCQHPTDSTTTGGPTERSASPTTPNQPPYCEAREPPSSSPKSTTVRITHHAKPATVLRGPRAAEFLAEVDNDPQEVMARWTGNYKRGNERTAKNHPRNRR